MVERKERKRKGVEEWTLMMEGEGEERQGREMDYGKGRGKGTGRNWRVWGRWVRRGRE